MKLLIAYIRPHKVDEVALALREIGGLTGVSASTARGWGHGKRESEKEHHGDLVSDFDEYARLDICYSDAIVDNVVNTIQSTASTGWLGDGKVFVCAVLDAVRIRTGERGEGAC